MDEDKTMPVNIPGGLVSRLSEYVNTNMGLYFPENRQNSLRRGITAAAKDFAIIFDIEDNPETCIEWLLSVPPRNEHLYILAEHLTIGETYFFRDAPLFKALENSILPELIHSRRSSGRKKLKFWSAGCCSGEEPYSIAILIDRMIPDRNDWDISILATDINARFLQKAGQGVYRMWSFRKTPGNIIEKYFTKQDKHFYEILPRLKKMVAFDQMNLARNPGPSLADNLSDMDIVLCRNVLIYFDNELRKKAIERLFASLSERGRLVVSPSETAFIDHPDLDFVRFPDLILHRKSKNAGSLKPAGKNGNRKELKPPLPDPYKKAQVLFDNEHYLECSDSLLEFMEQDKAGFGGNHNVMFLLAQSLLKAGKTDEARKWCESAVRTKSVIPGQYFLLSTIYQELGFFKESMSMLRYVLFLDKSFIPAHFSLGNLARLEGRNDESQKHLEICLSLLRDMNPERILPEAGGITAGKLMKLVRSMTNPSSN